MVVNDQATDGFTAMIPPETVGGKMRTIFVLLDGTWNDADAPGPTTSVVRLREVLRCQRAEHETGGAPDNLLVYYERGVGTSFFQRISGGAIGIGLDEGIRRAYRYLCDIYQSNDRLIIVGFSRGAYTARSLAGLISSVGLLKRENCIPNLEAAVWDLYRTKRGSRASGTQHFLQPYLRPRNEVMVDCLAVFDTVGALGVPVKSLWRFNRDLYEFHDVALSTSACLHLQALAIDEHREAFSASPWRGWRSTKIASTVEQVWFSGSHADIGGGYIDIGAQGPRIDDLPFYWMISRLNHHFVDLALHGAASVDQLSPVAITAPHHASRRGIYRIFPKAFRAIGHGAKIALAFREQVVCQDRYEPVLGEAVHISSLDRLGRQTLHEKQTRLYLPPNLMAAIPLLHSAYARPEMPDGWLGIVDWNGKLLLPNDEADAARASTLLFEVSERLKQVGAAD